MLPLNRSAALWRNFKMGASIAESKPRETGYKQGDQTLLQKQVIVSPGPAFVLTGPVCGICSSCCCSNKWCEEWNVVVFRSFFIALGYTSRASAAEKQRKKNTSLFCRSAFAFLYFYLSREEILSYLSFVVGGGREGGVITGLSALNPGSRGLAS